VGCESLPPVEYQSENVDIATFFASEVCAGSVLAIQESARVLAERLALHEVPHTTLYWGAEGVADHCSGLAQHPAGCYDHELNHVIATWAVIEHEFVHAHGSTIRVTDVTFEEGLAYGLTANIYDQSFATRPDSYLGMSRREFNGLAGSGHVSGHFVHWLTDTYGVQALLGMRDKVSANATRDVILSEFELAFGRPIESFEEEWAATAPESYDTSGILPTPRDAWVGDVLTVKRTLDCDEPDTLGPLTSPPYSPARDDEDGGYVPVTMDISFP
jgi:hypothetical protein